MVGRRHFDEFVHRATVQVLRMGTDGSGPQFAGTAFFVAPRVLVTTAGVARAALGAVPAGRVAVASPHVQDGIPLAARLWNRPHDETDHRPLEIDLAVLELLEDVGHHECVWLADRDPQPESAVAHGYTSEWSAEGDPKFSSTLPLRVASRFGGFDLHVLFDQFPQGFSGGPLIDEELGAVAGVIARRGDGEGLAVRTAALRRFGSDYQRLIAAHDIWHGSRHRMSEGRNWIDLQQEMMPAARAGVGWSPYDRRAALALLAGLPNPPDTATVAGLVTEADAWHVRATKAVSPLLMWRDGAGLLCNGGPPPALAQLRYLRLVAEHTASDGNRDTQLEEWIDNRVRMMPHRDRFEFIRRHGTFLPPSPAPTPQSPIDCWRTGGAVLVGIGDYDHMPVLPAVTNNLDDLRVLLTADFGMPTDNCRLLRNPRTSTEIHEAVDDIVDRIDPATGGLLFYYAGHGRSHPTHGRLMLSLAGSREDRHYTYWEYAQLRDHLIDAGPLTRLVLLDSCYSGAALEQLSTADDSVVAIDGTYVMASSGATEPSSAPVGARHTAFTGKVLSTLTQGIPGPSRVIDADSLFIAVRNQCRAAALPVPVRQVRNDGARIPLVPNKAYRRPLWDTSSA